MVVNTSAIPTSVQALVSHFRAAAAAAAVPDQPLKGTLGYMHATYMHVHRCSENFSSAGDRGILRSSLHVMHMYVLESTCT